MKKKGKQTNNLYSFGSKITKALFRFNSSKVKRDGPSGGTDLSKKSATLSGNGKKGRKKGLSLFRVPMWVKAIRLKLLELRYLPHLQIRLVHDKTYAKGGRYKKWTDKPYSSKIHKASLVAFLASFMIFTFAQGVFPNIFNLWKDSPVKAGNHSVTWNTYNHFTNNGATGSNYTGATGQSNITINGFGAPDDAGVGLLQIDELVEPDPNYVPANWLSGRIGTVLEGKEVYYQNLAGTYQWQTSETSCVGPQCVTGLDPVYPDIHALVADNTLNFSAYPARNACKNIGGRLPYMDEIREIYAGQTSYGNNFGGGYYWSATEYYDYPAIAMNWKFPDNRLGASGKLYDQYVRCVQGYLLPSTLSSLRINSQNTETNWSTVSWSSASLPANTEIIVNVRTSNDGSAWSAWSADFTQDADGSTTGSGDLSSLSNSQWLDMKVTLFSEDGVGNPTLTDITVDYDNIDSPTNLTQYNSDSEEIDTDGWNNGTTTLKADVTTAAANPSTLTPEIEMNTTGSFSGTAGTPEGITFTPSDISYSGSPITNANLGTVSGMPPGSDTYYWKVRYTDGSGRVSPWSSTQNSFKIEQAPPTGTVTIDDGENTNDPNVNLTLSATDTGGSGISQMRFSNNGSDFSDWETYATTKEWDITATTYNGKNIGGNSDEEEKTVYVQYRDNAGNVSGRTFTSQADWESATISKISVNNGSAKLADNGYRGSGVDGDVVVSSNLDISTTGTNGRSYADAWGSRVTSLTQSSATLQNTPAVGAVEDNDEMLLISLSSGYGSPAYNVGSYEFVRVSSIVSNVINFANNKQQYYGNSVGGDNLSGQVVFLQRVPNYNSLTIDNSTVLSASSYNESSATGVLAFRVKNELVNNGTINADSKGFSGGLGGIVYAGGSTVGAQRGGTPIANGGGGRGQDSLGCAAWNAAGSGSVGTGGGGGGDTGCSGCYSHMYSGAGGNAGYFSVATGGTRAGITGVNITGGNGGAASGCYGGGGGGGGLINSSIDLSSFIYLGSGGGGGGSSIRNGGSPSYTLYDFANGGKGGNGGGIIIISANTITNNSVITSKGMQGGSGADDGYAHAGDGASGSGGLNTLDCDDY